MSKKNKPQKEGGNNEIAEQYTKRTYFIVAVVLIALAAVAFACTFIVIFIDSWGIYFLIASILLELTALAFLSTQKKKNNFKGVSAATVVAYILLGLSLSVFVGGMITVIVLG